MDANGQARLSAVVKPVVNPPGTLGLGGQSLFRTDQR
jgi:hypothetical protein